MYHTAFPPQAMVHVMSNYGASGQYMTLPNHAFFINSRNNLHQQDISPLTRVPSNHNRHRGIQGSYPFDFLHFMDVETSPHQSSYHITDRTIGNWERRVNSPTPAMSPPRYNYRALPGPQKKQTWNNFYKQGKRHPYTETYNHEPYHSSDSSLGSRSPTPNKYYKDGSQTESSDDRESINSLPEQELRNTRQNHSTLNRNKLVSSVSTQNLCPTQRQTNHYPNGTTRAQSQNYQNKRRYNTGRNSSPLRTPRNRKFTGLLMSEYNIFPRLYCTAPERFLQKSQSIQVKQKPNNLLTGSIYDKLSKAVWEKFEQNQQTETTFCNKMYLWKCLLVYIRSKFPQYGLFLVGSTLNGFGSDISDVDMCLLLRNTEMDQKNEAIFRLEQILKCLKKCEFIDRLELIQAKVPILKFHSSIYNVDVDLNCNNAVGIRNTHLLYCYSQIDWRVRPLVLVVKMWAQCQNINDAKNMTISSYSLVLMVIHFLQCGVSPIILPCLHDLFKGKFDPMSDVHSIDLHEELDIPSSALHPRNQQSLGELLIEFFKYYNSFNYDQYAISVRSANKIPIEHCRLVRSYKNDPHQWKYLCIEEPFDFTNTARSVYDPTVFAKIKGIFKQTYQRLSKTHNLSNIFNKLDDN